MSNLCVLLTASDGNDETLSSKSRTVQRPDVVIPVTTEHVAPYLLHKLFLAVSLLFLMDPDVVCAESFYVSPTGSDTNNGSQSAPFRTIRKAASVVTAGSTVHVAPGTYIGTISTSKTGTASARIRYVSDTKWGAKLVPPSDTGSGDIFWSNSGNYVDIEGFEVDGSSNPYFRVGITSGGGYTRIFNNYVHDIVGTSPNAVECCGGAGINLPGSGYSDTRLSEAFNNVVGRIGDIEGRYRPKDWIPIHAIYLPHAGLKAYNNIVYQTEANGIHLQHNPQGLVISNNLAFKAAGCAFYIGGYDGRTARNNIIQNGIAIDSGQAFCQNGAADSSNRWYNNISWRNGSVGYSSGRHTALITADPKLVNYKADGTGDYHLAAGSPAIDRGTSSMAAAIDYDGVIRPIGAAVDIGPYEYGSGKTGGIRIAASPRLPVTDRRSNVWTQQ